MYLNAKASERLTEKGSLLLELRNGRTSWRLGRLVCGIVTAKGGRMMSRIYQVWQIALFSACFIVELGSLQAMAYTPPVGIPVPSFGIEEVAPGRPALWPGAVATGFYYIDNTAATATDTGNIYGYPDKPRVSLPSSLAAGAYVEIHGGPYEGAQLTIVAQGTREQPVWIRGASVAERPTIRREMIVNGTYIILENLRFDTQQRTITFRYKSAAVNYACIRHSEFIGTGVSVGNTTVVGISGSSTATTTNVVVYDNDISGFGERASVTENDYHGVLPGEYAAYIWVVGNRISANGGDSIQIGQASYTTAQRPHHVYVGGNIFHDDRENCVDIKRSDYVVISENECYGYRETSSSAGEAIVLHDGPTNVWIVNNKVHSSTRGLVTTGSLDTYFVGNTIYDIHHETSVAWDPGSGYSGGAAMHFRGTTTGGALNNTLFDYDIGVQIAGGTGYELRNNMFGHRAESAGSDLHFTSTTLSTNSNVNNLVFQSPPSAQIREGATTMTLTSYRSTRSKCLTSCFETTSPQFVNPDSGNFHIISVSSALNAGASIPAFQAFADSFGGASIMYDADGTVRPAGTAIDVGADEYATSASDPAPAAPNNLKISPGQ